MLYSFIFNAIFQYYVWRQKEIEMETFRCSRCSKVSISIEGNRCFHCGYNETRETSIPENPTVMEIRCASNNDKDNFLHLHNISVVADCSILPQAKDECIDGQNIEWNGNTSETDQDYNATSKISDSIASNRGSACSVDDGLAMPGPSGLCENKNTSNLCGEAFQSFTCGVCKVAIAEHATEGNTFKCCNCSYINSDAVDLQIHSYTHVPKTICRICDQEHAVGNSHNSNHICPSSECEMTFQCRTRLYQHFEEHPEYFKENCWVCRRTFREHIPEKEYSYVCCICGFKSTYPSSLVSHNRLHPPRFYCRLCGEEYYTEENCFHRSEFTCFECREIFVCQTQLENHFRTHGYSKNCIICKRIINEHSTIIEGIIEFQCCKEECLQTFDCIMNLQKHLFSHTGLRVFKCPICGKRFPVRDSVRGHKGTCKKMPFKCEICEIRFHSRDILHTHFLVNHRQA